MSKKKEFSIKNFKLSKLNILIFLGIFVAVGGTILWFTSRAATTAVSIFSDKGTVSSPASIINDSSAADGHAVKYGTTAASLKNPGIFLIWGGTDETTKISQNSFLQGGQIALDWAGLQTGLNSWNWKELDQQLQEYHNLGKQATVQVNSDHLKPSWVNVPNCGSYSSSSTTSNQEIPLYWNTSSGSDGLNNTYATDMQSLISGLANHIASSPYKDAVLGIRTAPNLIGTETYDPVGHITNSACTGWTISKGYQSYAQVMEMWYNTMQSAGIRPIMRSRYYYEVLHGIDPALETQRIASELGPTKGWTFSTNADPDTPILDGNFAETYVKNGTTVGYQESDYYGASTNNPISWNYWRVLMELGRGTSYIGVYGDVASNGFSGATNAAAYDSAYAFANEYAGTNTNPSGTPGAWIAFRGTEKTNNTCDISQGDYTWFTSLNNASNLPCYDSNSGKSMLGSLTGNPPYGRYARRTDIASGHNTFEISLDNSFKASLSGSVSVTVTYLDKGTGSWTLQYGTGSDNSFVQKKYNTNTWQQTTVSVPVSSLTGNLSGGSDLTLTANGSDTYFHMIEVDRN